MVSTDDVKKLRDATGVSVMQCKSALDEAKGDFNKAQLILQKKGTALAAKKAGRELAAGRVSAYVHATKEVGAMVLLQSETDFVAKNEEFIALAYDIAMHIAAANPQYIKREDVEPEKMNDLRALFEKEVADKPENIREQILTGKVDAYLKHSVLLEQDYIKDPEKNIKDLLDAATQKFGERVEVGRFARFSVR